MPAWTLPKALTKAASRRSARSATKRPRGSSTSSATSPNIEAAKARWEQQDDPKGCREALEKLLARNPQHRDARLLMAELLLAEDDPQGAYEHAKAALDAYPNDAQVQYTMALTLDASGRTSDALAYYERATKMDPQNEAFAAAYQTAREAAREECASRRRRADVTDRWTTAAAGHAGGLLAPRLRRQRAARADSSGAARSADFCRHCGR